MSISKRLYCQSDSDTGRPGPRRPGRGRSEPQPRRRARLSGSDTEAAARPPRAAAARRSSQSRPGGLRSFHQVTRHCDRDDRDSE
jgi:hypothetical protein